MPIETRKEVDLYIIVADDNIKNHELVKRAFIACEKNCIITSVFNGRQLLDLVEHKGFHRTTARMTPNLIILDLEMPLMNGLDALKYLKSKEEFAHIPVYIVAELQDEDKAQKALAAGAADYFVKPLEFPDLVKMAEAMCRGTARGN